MYATGVLGTSTGKCCYILPGCQPIRDKGTQTKKRETSPQGPPDPVFLTYLSRAVEEGGGAWGGSLEERQASKMRPCPAPELAASPQGPGQPPLASCKQTTFFGCLQFSTQQQVLLRPLPTPVVSPGCPDCLQFSRPRDPISILILPALYLHWEAAPDPHHLSDNPSWRESAVPGPLEPGNSVLQIPLLTISLFCSLVLSCWA